MVNSKTPQNQSIFINSTQGRIFDFNTPSSRVYLGEAVNSLLRVFGNDVIITGFRILDYQYLENDVITVTISPGEAILDNTLIKYPEPITLSIDVSGFNDGVLFPNLFFNFCQIQQRNSSSIRLTHAIETTSQLNLAPDQLREYHAPTSHWFPDYSILILAVIEFNKENKLAFKRQIPLLNRERIKIVDKEYTIYPSDQISHRILLYLNDTFN